MAWLLVLTGITAQEVRMLQTDVPQRPAGQRDVLQLAVPPIPTVRVGFIGLGMRGPLTRLSLENNSMPVAIPDFTRGAWNRINGFSFAF